MSDYSKAHSSFQRAVDVEQQSSSPNTFYVQRYRDSLERVQKKL
jgi:hypothetical protein